MKIGDCDCCGEHRELVRVIYLGMDTEVCAECRGDVEENERNQHGCDDGEALSGSTRR